MALKSRNKVSASFSMSSMTDMIIQTQGFDDIDTLEERIEQLREEQDEPPK